MAVQIDIIHSKKVEWHMEWDKIPVWPFYKMGLLDLHSTEWILFSVYSRHSSFSPSADVIPMSNDIAHAWQCMFALSLCEIVLYTWTEPGWDKVSR